MSSADQSRRLSLTAREAIANPGHQAWLSVVSVWEIAAKHALGRLSLPESPEVFIPRLREDARLDSLPLDESAVMMLPRLPSIHKDPFDRMLACQALAEGMVLVTPDRDLARYPVRTLW